MKGIYIAAIDYNKPNYFGVYKKIRGQIKALKNLEVEVDSILIKDSKMIINKTPIDKKIPRPFYIGFHKLILKELKRELLKYDFAYLRFSRNDIYFLKLIKYLSKNNIKTIVEIPTYPYDKEFDYSLKQNIYRIIDKFVTANMFKYTDRIATTNSIDSIFNIETIQIRNGVCLDSIDIVNENINNKDSINFVGVANLAKWHGYDRLIKGISNYNSSQDIKQVNFYIIGEGEEKENLVKLTKELNLENNIHFLGAKRGNELKEFLYNMDIGVSSLALFRAGGGHDPIKTKEFLAQGFPVMLGYDDKLVDMSLPYIFKVSENNDDIHVDKIVKLYDELNISGQDIRKYAEDNLSWESQMKKIVNIL